MLILAVAAGDDDGGLSLFNKLDVLLRASGRQWRFFGFSVSGEKSDAGIANYQTVK